jgi:hypothetical protein
MGKQNRRARRSPSQRRTNEDTTVSYISESTAELALLAQRQGHTALTYLLQMATLESERLCGNLCRVQPHEREEVAGVQEPGDARCCR